MNWKFTGDRPVYQQIIDTVCGAILRRELCPGDRFPSVRELAAQARVNPNTMQRSLMELEREGILVGSGTSGRHVTTDGTVLEAMRRRMLDRLVRECADKFLQLGISPTQAGELLADFDKEGS